MKQKTKFYVETWVYDTQRNNFNKVKNFEDKVLGWKQKAVSVADYRIIES